MLTRQRFPSALALAVALLAGIGCGQQVLEDENVGRGHFTSRELLEADPALGAPRGDLREVSERGLQLTKKSEGWSARLYNDAASYCTIGYGHLVRKAPCNGRESPEFLAGLTQTRGTEILIDDMKTARATVTSAVTVDLTDGQFAALVDFVFNVGSRNFRDSTLLDVVNTDQTDRVAGQFRRWVLAGGKVWPGLKTRREAEVVLFFEGLPPPRSAPEPTPQPEIDVELGERP
jgi:lysozyme